MKKYGVIIDITNDFLAFWSGYCTHIRATFLLSPPSLSIKIAAIKIEEDITSQKIIKKSSKKIWLIFYKRQINCLVKIREK